MLILNLKQLLVLMFLGNRNLIQDVQGYNKILSVLYLCSHYECRNYKNNFD